MAPLALLLASLAAADGGPGGPVLQLDRGDYSLAAQVDDAGIVGGGVSLTRYGDQLRGNVQRLGASFDTSAKEVRGGMGDDKVDLALDDRGPELVARGTYAGIRSELHLSPDAVRGLVGLCGYELHRGPDGDFHGSSKCSGGPVLATRLHLPDGFRRTSPANQILALAVTLSQLPSKPAPFTPSASHLQNPRPCPLPGQTQVTPQGLKINAAAGPGQTPFR